MDVVLTAPPSIAARHKFRRHDLSVHLYAYPPLAPSTPLFPKIALCLHGHSARHFGHKTVRYSNWRGWLTFWLEATSSHVAVKSLEEGIDGETYQADYGGHQQTLTYRHAVD